MSRRALAEQFRKAKETRWEKLADRFNEDASADHGRERTREPKPPKPPKPDQ